MTRRPVRNRATASSCKQPKRTDPPAQYRRRGGHVQFGVLLAARASPTVSTSTSCVESGAAAEGEGAVGPEGEVQWGRAGPAGMDGVLWLRARFGDHRVLVLGNDVEPGTPAEPGLLTA